MRFLLDTNILSKTMRVSPSRRLLAKLAQHEGQLGMSVVTWQELAYGVRRLPEGARKKALGARLLDIRELLPALPFTLDAADWLATERARLEAKGTLVATEDGQIAATAWSENMTLVTANTRHFSRFRGLVIADWTT